MFKGLGKLKVGKDKTKKEKSERTDEAGTTIPKASVKTKEKGKEKPRSVHQSKKKKGTETNSAGDLSQSSDEAIPSGKASPAVFEDHSDVHKVKGKRRISKTCEEAVNKAVTDLFESAWKVCAERFFITTAPVTVCCDLRNTWLRIVEAEWQDPDMREKPSAKPNRIFKRDDPPLPLAYDSWSRGALEPLPTNRRESVLDPFLRDLNSFGVVLNRPDNIISVSASPIEESFEETEEISPENDESPRDIVEVTMEQKEQVSDNVVAPADENLESTEETAEKDKWNFDLDPKISHNFESEINIVSDLKSSPEPHFSNDSGIPRNTGSEVWEGGGSETLRSSGSQTGGISVYTLVSARPLTFESTTDRELSSGNSSEHSGARRIKKSKKRFSGSQCGGRTGSGVFRLPLETTSEAIFRMEQGPGNVRIEASHIVEQNAEYHEDIVQLTKRGELAHKHSEEELVVQPLFEEHTPRQVMTTEDRNKNDARRRSSYRAKYFKLSVQSLHDVESETTSRFLKRKIVNLHGHFKRQAMRSLAARARQKEDAMLQDARRVSSSSSFLSRSSTISRSTNFARPGGGDTFSRNYANRKPSQSVSTANVSRGDSVFYLVNRQSVKGIPSELPPPLPNANSNTSEKKGELKNKNFKTMANVRASHRADYRSLAGKFKDTKHTPAQLQARFENKKTFFHQGRAADTGCVCTPSSGGTCSNNCCPP